MTYEDIVEIALAMPEVEMALMYGQPVLKRAGRFMLSDKQGGEVMVSKMDWETHDRLLDANPEIFFKTPHYEPHPYLQARVGLLSEEMARALIQVAWDEAPNRAKRQFKR
jgi:hypothetical protein